MPHKMVQFVPQLLPLTTCYKSKLWHNLFHFMRHQHHSSIDGGRVSANTNKKAMCDLYSRPISLQNSYNIFVVKIHQKFSLFSRWKSTKVSIWYVIRTGMALCLCVRWAPTMFNIRYTAGINSISCDAYFFFLSLC